MNVLTHPSHKEVRTPVTSVVMCDEELAPRRSVVDRSRPLPCSDDPELFWPVSEDGPSLLQIAEAKAVCAGCPQAAACLEEALAARAEGIWGGTTEQERTAILRRRRALGRSA